jgi:hypothetical protein
MIVTNEGDSFPVLMGLLKEGKFQPDLLLLKSESEFSAEPDVHKMFKPPRIVCEGKPIYMLASLTGEKHEGAELYVRFLGEHCEDDAQHK